MMAAALTRRAALLGAVAALGAPIGSGARAERSRQIGELTDARLTAMGAEVDRTLDGAAFALAPDEPEDQDARLNHADKLLGAMAAIPAVGFAGILAKAKAWLDSDGYDVQGGGDLTESMCQDIERLHSAGGLV